MKFDFVKEHKSHWPIEIQCRALGVSRSGYYKHLKQEPGKTALKQMEIVREIRKIHGTERFDDYGSPRMHQLLLKNGYSCCVNTVARLMHEENIKARISKRFKVLTTDSNHDLPIAPNLLNQQFVAEKPNQIWLTDITYINTKEGFTYLCTVLDLYSRKIVGWATSRKINTELVISALLQAIVLRSSLKGLILHSDRGSQYASQAFQECLSQYGVVQSMSRRGNCYDNAPQESFYKSFKVEEVYRRDYETHEEATRGVRDYIDRFYNCERLHSSLGYVSPADYESRRLWERSETA